MRILTAIMVGLWLVPATAAAQGTKTVQGTVAKTAPDAITVKVGDQEMTFKVDSSTRVTARGGSTATREARAEGKPGAAYTDLVKVGQGVEVGYRDAGMVATSIRVLAGPPPPPSPPSARSMTASGIVTAVSDASLTVKGSAGESTYTVDQNTRVVGTGLGTKAKELRSAGQKPTITGLVQSGDTVSVRYTEADGAKKASEVRITKKAKS